MMPPQAGIAAGIRYLRERDPVLREVIDRVGAFKLRPEPDLFLSLVRAIVAQQISTGAARSIFQRLIQLAGGEDRLLACLLSTPPEELRTARISPQKAGYLRDLAHKVSSGAVRIEALPEMPNDEVIAELTQVKGIGVWTVQMLLIFSLGRLDVFPAADLGIRTAIHRLYKTRGLPKPARLARLEKIWQPYASIASWYCWRSLEFPEYKTKQARP